QHSGDTFCSPSLLVNQSISLGGRLSFNMSEPATSKFDLPFTALQAMKRKKKYIRRKRMKSEGRRGGWNQEGRKKDKGQVKDRDNSKKREMKKKCVKKFIVQGASRRTYH